jgi:hypothetical protein
MTPLMPEQVCELAAMYRDGRWRRIKQARGYPRSPHAAFSPRGVTVEQSLLFACHRAVEATIEHVAKVGKRPKLARELAEVFDRRYRLGERISPFEGRKLATLHRVVRRRPVWRTDQIGEY